MAKGSVYGSIPSKDDKYSWLVVPVAFVSQGLSVGFYFCYGSIFVEILKIYDTSESEAAWIGSIGYSFCFTFGFVTSLLCNKFGCGLVMSLGGAFIGLGALLSSFARNPTTLLVTYGVIMSIGASCLFFASLLVLPLYFNKRLGLVNGIVSAGSGIGGITLSPFLAFFIKHYGLQKTFQCYAIFALLPMTGSLFIKRKRQNVDTTRTASETKTILCFYKSILGNKAFILFTTAMSLILFAYYIPFVHLINFASIRGIDAEVAGYLPSIIAASGVLGKVIFGYVSMLRGINRLYMFQGFLLSLSVSLTLLPLASNYLHLTMFAVAFGISEGGFSSYIVVVCSQLLHSGQLAAGFGMMYTVSSLFSLLGPPFAGLLFAKSGSYEVAFLLCGGMLMCGAISLFFVPYLIPQDIFYERMKVKQVSKSVTNKQKCVSIEKINTITKSNILVTLNYDYTFLADVSDKSLLNNTQTAITLDEKDSNANEFTDSSNQNSDKSTFMKIADRYLSISNLVPASSLVNIPPYASQDYIENYFDDPTDFV